MSEPQWLRIKSFVRDGALVDCFHELEHNPPVKGGKYMVKWPNGDVTEETLLITSSQASDFNTWDCASLVLHNRGFQFTLRVAGTPLRFQV